MSLNVEQAVANGIRLLDEKEEGWREKIDLDTLYINSLSFCVLGQIYSSANSDIPFMYGVYKLGINELDISFYGFAMNEFFGFVELNDEWRRQLGLRLNLN